MHTVHAVGERGIQTSLVSLHVEFYGGLLKISFENSVAPTMSRSHVALMRRGRRSRSQRHSPQIHQRDPKPP
jgi:hypothetical protein